MPKEDEEKAESKSSGDTAKNEAAAAAKDVEASDTGDAETSTVTTNDATANQLVIADDSSDEEPPVKKNKPDDKSLNTASMIATTNVTDVSSTQILIQTSTHDLRDTAAVRQVSGNLLTPLLTACEAYWNKTFVVINMNSTPNESQNPPQLTLLVSLQVKSNTQVAGVPDILEQNLIHGRAEIPFNIAHAHNQMLMGLTTNWLEDILKKPQTDLPNAALIITINVDEAPFAGLSAAEKNKRTEVRREARDDLLMHFATHDNLNDKKLIPLYLKFLYLADEVDEQETPQEEPNVTFPDVDDILAEELSGEDEEEADYEESVWGDSDGDMEDLEEEEEEEEDAEITEVNQNNAEEEAEERDPFLELYDDDYDDESD